jgi:hypothetical protein
MTLPQDWSGVAYNQATASENRIHADDVARRYGFRGGLVPGVTVYAYLVQPAVTAWGMDWLEGGHARGVFRTPLYDGASFRVETKAEPDRFDAELFDEDGNACAEGDAGLGTPAGDRTQSAPVLRGDPRTPRTEERPPAIREVLEGLRESGLGAFRTTWTAAGEHERYLRDLDAVPALLRPDGGAFAHPMFSLGLANTALSVNVSLGPWIHVQSDVQHFAAIPRGSELIVEASVEDLFERGGHEFVDLDVGVFVAPDRPAMRARHRAIYLLREPAG